MRIRRPLLALAVVATSLSRSPVARADAPAEPPGAQAPVEAELDTTALFKTGLAALAAGKPGEAIAKLEALGDRGVIDPTVSYDRGLAYAERVRAGSEVPGDLGRAAHGFEEARGLTHDATLAADAAAALTAVRSEVARRRARGGDPVEIEAGFSLGRSIVDLVPENVWAAIAGVVALVLTGAFVARRLASVKRAKVAATTTAAISGALLAGAALLTWEARDARLNLREGVIVAPNARLLDDNHLVIASVSPIPEGVRVRLLDPEPSESGFTRLLVLGVSGSLPSSSVLPLLKR